MAGKPNIRSIRFSDEMAELIDRQVGSSFTEKFENLVSRCVWELPEREKQLAKIQEQINRERKQLFSLRKATEELRRLEQDIQSAQRYFAIVERRAKAIAEATERDVTQVSGSDPLDSGQSCVTKSGKQSTSKKP